MNNVNTERAFPALEKKEGSDRQVSPLRLIVWDITWDNVSRVALRRDDGKPTLLVEYGDFLSEK